MKRLTSCLRCVRDTPSCDSFWGYIFVRNIQSILTAWGGIIYAGILTYEALRVTDCLPADDSRACSRDGADDEDDTPGCRRLWGLLAPESLLTVIATAGAVVIALSSAFVGNYMDSTPHRRQIAMGGSYAISFFALICAAIVSPSEGVLIICSVSLFILTVLKEVLVFTLETYAPELSSTSAEVAAAITAGNLWFYTSMVGWLLVMAVIGVGLSSSMFGPVTSVLTGSAILLFAVMAFSKLPDVPASHPQPEGYSTIQMSLTQLKALGKKTYHMYPDMGLVLLANMVFDPALNAIFVVAIQILVAAYHFTSQEIPVIFLCAVICSVPGIAFSKFVTSSALWEFFEKPTACADVPAGSCMAGDGVCVGDVENEIVPSSEIVGSNEIELVEHNDERIVVEEGFANSLDMAEDIPAAVYNHPRRILVSLCCGLGAIILVTILAPFILQPCDIGLAILVGCMWSFCMCYNWNCSTMLRAALVPGGSEAEFAGLAIVAFNIISWLPLLIFLIMANAGFLIEAMWSLCIFFAVGIAVLCFVDIDRGIAARDKTMHLRRWVRNSNSCRPESIVSAEACHIDGNEDGKVLGTGTIPAC